MSEQEPTKLLILPSFIQTKEQVHRTLSEILQIEDFLNKAQNREPGSKLSLPKTTADLDKFAEANKRNVLNHAHRMDLAKFLRDIYKLAPEVGLVVPVRADAKMIDSIVGWFRSNIHAQMLVQTTVQNKLYGGAIVRIKHKTYDLSLASRFTKVDSTLRESLAMRAPEPATTGRANYL